MKIEGLRVVDAKQSVIIDISKSDAVKGKSKDPSKCAAALACYRELGCTDARVHLGRTYLRFNGKWTRYMTGKALRDEIISFDRAGKFAPGEYTLYAMTPSHWATGKRYGGNGTQKRRKNKKHSRVRHVVSGVRPTFQI